MEGRTEETLLLGPFFPVIGYERKEQRIAVYKAFSMRTAALYPYNIVESYSCDFGKFVVKYKTKYPDIYRNYATKDEVLRLCKRVPTIHKFVVVKPLSSSTENQQEWKAITTFENVIVMNDIMALKSPGANATLYAPIFWVKDGEEGPLKIRWSRNELHNATEFKDLLPHIKENLVSLLSSDDENTDSVRRVLTDASINGKRHISEAFGLIDVEYEVEEEIGDSDLYVLRKIRYESVAQLDAGLLVKDADARITDPLCCARYNALVRVDLSEGAVAVKMNSKDRSFEEVVDLSPYAISVNIYLSQVPLGRIKLRDLGITDRAFSDKEALAINGRLPVVIKISAVALFDDLEEAFKKYKRIVKEIGEGTFLYVFGGYEREETPRFIKKELSKVDMIPPIPNWADGVVKDWTDQCYPIKRSGTNKNLYYRKLEWKALPEEKCRKVFYGVYLKKSEIDVDAIGQDVLIIEHYGKNYVTYKKVDKLFALNSLLNLVIRFNGEIEGNKVRLHYIEFARYLENNGLIKLNFNDWTSLIYYSKEVKNVTKYIMRELGKVDAFAIKVLNRNKKNNTSVIMIIYLPQLKMFIELR